jgi:hypothetical protein
MHDPTSVTHAARNAVNQLERVRQPLEYALIGPFPSRWPSREPETYRAAYA